ncbi:DUF3772 domain-containing protein [Sphingomonas sp. 22R3R2A-7]|uniref:DUF3772 domain-containing protein n=1 Tax=Sphingomonas sp. 22R3R2A-7 TaxID=3050230 RepID=UPI003FA6E4FE
MVEAPEIRQQRRLLAQSQSALDSAIKRARLIGVEAKQQIDDIGAAEAEELGQQLSEKSPSPLSPTLWTAIVDHLPRDTARLNRFAAGGAAVRPAVRQPRRDDRARRAARRAGAALAGTRRAAPDGARLCDQPCAGRADKAVGLCAVAGGDRDAVAGVRGARVGDVAALVGAVVDAVEHAGVELRRAVVLHRIPVVARRRTVAARAADVAAAADRRYRRAAPQALYLGGGGADLCRAAADRGQRADRRERGGVDRGERADRGAAPRADRERADGARPAARGGVARPRKARAQQRARDRRAAGVDRGRRRAGRDADRLCQFWAEDRPVDAVGRDRRRDAVFVDDVHRRRVARGAVEYQPDRADREQRLRRRQPDGRPDRRAGVGGAAAGADHAGDRRGDGAVRRGRDLGLRAVRDGRGRRHDRRGDDFAGGGAAVVRGAVRRAGDHARAAALAGQQLSADDRDGCGRAEFGDDGRALCGDHRRGAVGARCAGHRDGEARGRARRAVGRDRLRVAGDHAELRFGSDPARRAAGQDR